jgi:acetoin utilization protein AcuB
VLAVGDVMRRHVRVVTPDTSVRTAALQLLQLNIESLLVTDDRELVGIVTERDILAAMMPRLDEIMAAGGVRGIDLDDIARGHSSQPVRDIMTRAIETTTQNTSVMKALGLMLAHRLRRLPVLDPATGQLVGIVTQRDLLGVVCLGAVSQPVGY